MTRPLAPTRVCGFADGDPTDICGAPAAYHFLSFTEEDGPVSLFACTTRDHAVSAAHGAHDYHRVGEVCGQRGTKWQIRHETGLGFCYSEDDTHAAALHGLTLEVTT